jgi:hypothetical protein
MRTLRFLDRIRAELEAPTEQRMFGSGWIAGSLGILAGLVGLAMVIILRNPQLTTVPELAIINKSALFRPALYFIPIAGFSLAALCDSGRPARVPRPAMQCSSRHPLPFVEPDGVRSSCDLP